MSLKAMSQADFLEMLKIGTVDTGTGTLFGVPRTRAVNTSRLTLVISTGGSGQTAIKKAIYTARQKLNPNYSTYMKFLVLDSATNELEPLRKDGIDTLNISAPQAKIRLSDENRSVFYRKFIDKSFPVHVIDSEGASQQRLLGKAKLYDQNDGSTNDQLLHNKIAGYFAGDWSAHTNLPVDIMILTGISGGNGSGTFIDIASIAKQACPNPANVTVFGYIMLPDTAERFADNDISRQSLYRNGFAALKELESYESIGLENGRKEIIVSNEPAFNVELSSLNIPYTYPVLISGDYDEAVNMIAETIINSVANNGGGFSQHSFYSNRDAIRLAKLSRNNVGQAGILRTGDCPEDSHMYCGIGYAQASIPEKVVIPYLVGAVSKRMYLPEADSSLASAQHKMAAFCTKEKSLNKLDFQQAMRFLLGLNANQELRPDNLWLKILAHFNKFCKVKDNSVEVSYDDIVSGNTMQYRRGFRGTEVAATAGQKMNEAIQAEMEMLKQKARQIMIMYGPRAIQYLYDGVGNPDETGKREDFSAFSLKTQIEFVNTRFMDQKRGKEPIPPNPKGIIGKLFEAWSKTETTRWMKDARICEENNVKYTVAQTMTGANGVWESSFVGPVKEFLGFVQRFADVLETVSDYYRGIGKSLESDDFQQFMKQSGENNGINLCRDASMYAWVRGRVNAKLANIDPRNVRENVIEDFYRNTDRWISGDEGIARRQYDEVMSRVCAVGKYSGQNNGLNLTITDYFDHVIDSIPPARQAAEINNAVHLIFGQLKTKSEPSLKLQNGVGRDCNGIIMLPSNLQAGASGQMIQQAFMQELGNAGLRATQFVYSSVVDSIVCYQTSVADAVSHLKDLSLWEDAYNSGNTPTLHLHNGEYITMRMKSGYSQFNELSMPETDKEMGEKNIRKVYPAMAERSDAIGWMNRVYGTGLTWRHYPSINVNRYGSVFDDTNPVHGEEAAYRSGIFRERIEEALRIGIIECEKNGNTYKYYINLIPDDWTSFKLRNYKNKNRDGSYVRGRELFDYLKAQNPHSTKSFRKQICLKDSDFFGAGGFDFSQIIALEHWEQARIDREHKAYMMRIMRKSTALYQDMEDTLWRFYPVEYELEEKELDAMRLQAYRNFAEFYLYGVVNSDEDQYEWTVRIDAGGSDENLISFSRRRISTMDGMSRNLLREGLKLKIVYDAFKDVKGEMELSDGRLKEIQDKVSAKLSEKDFDTLVDTRLEYLQKEYEIYRDKYGKEKDPLDAIMEAYKIEDDDIEYAQRIVDLYDVIGEVIEEQKSFA